MHQLCFAAWARANFALFVRVAYGGVLHARFDKADYERRRVRKQGTARPQRRRLLLEYNRSKGDQGQDRQTHT